MTRATTVAFSLVLAAGGCGGEGGPRDGEPAVEVVRRDSAGVEIIENRGDLSALPTWTLPAEPELRLGAVDGPPELQFFRVSAGRRLPDGRLVVANGGSSEIRVFAPDGSFQRAFGTEGEGPEEFGGISGLWGGPGDTLLIYDGRNQRLARWTAAGDFLGVSPLSPTFMNPPTARGRFSDGSVLFEELYFDLPESGFDWAPTVLRRYGPDATELDTLARLPGRRIGRFELPGDQLFAGSPHFAARAIAAAGGEHAHLVTGQAYEVQRLGLDGELNRLMRWTGPPREVTEADVQALREESLATSETDEQRRRALQFFEARPAENEFPTAENLALSTDGMLWVREYERPGDDPAQDWLVFDPDGALAARIRLPERLRILEIGPDYLLGVEPDELEVEYVVSYPLPRGSP